MNTLTILLMAQPANGSASGPGLIANLILFGSIILIFYFMIIRPQQKRQKERQHMLDSMKKGDKVITAGGIYGTIEGIDERTVYVKIAENVKIKLDKNSISVVLKEDESTTK
ncbi:MAG: preprotein translocase subunit YajC [Bacteroidetes bacterium]|nr:preprotein translocase subunit YajC [Bacteroidota bacterium]